uniref:PI3K/PI4K domain-containing protein n=1 Tax=Rhabditophanes sp. KR3021 TaxID=114890 RepID=A0AC35U1B3_9BILA
MAAGFKGDRVPFIFTPDMEFVIKNCLEEGSDGYHYFVNDCCDAFNLIRKNCSILLNALKLMKSSGIPNLSENSIAFVENNLQLTLSDEEAMAYFTRMIEESVNSVFPRLNFLIHHVANQVKKPFKSNMEE